jgi:RHS repeat-associated protein
VRTYQDFYPFGMLAPGRKYNGPNYSRGFNGMLKDDEVKGSGNSYTTKFRQYDSRLGRWLSTDPVTQHRFSPYSAFDNNPIFYVDPNGDVAGKYVTNEGEIIGDDGQDNDNLYLVRESNDINIIRMNDEKGEVTKQEELAGDIVRIPTIDKRLQQKDIYNMSKNDNEFEYGQLTLSTAYKFRTQNYKGVV